VAKITAVNASCSYCETVLPEFSLDPIESFVVKCPKCKRDLLLVSNKGKHIPLLPEVVKKPQNYEEKDNKAEGESQDEGH
jgi:phage FluMu protein Com